MNDKPFKILSIDGGGIKGLYSASVLARLEEKSGRKSGDCFDMICGTSTGGLIALGLASGKPAQELVDLYINKGNKIFPTYENKIIRWFQRNIIHLFSQTLFFGKYSSKGLRKVLDETFGELKMRHLNNLVCIPSYNLISGMPRVFKFPHREGDYFMDGDIPVVDVALATSAAPTYFPIHEYGNTLYIDGGLWANNPSLCGLLEAIKHFVGDGKLYSHVEILSISSISHPIGWSGKSRKSRSFIGWRSKLIQTSMQGQAYFAHFFLNTALKNINNCSIYERIESPNLSREQMILIEMDRSDKKALSTLSSLGNHEGYTNALKPEIKRFFESLKTYKTN